MTNSSQATECLDQATGPSIPRVFRPKSSIPPSIPPYLDAIAARHNGSWMVGLVMPRAEKALAWHLHDQEITYYLPLKKYRDARRRIMDVPAIDGYIFFAGDNSTANLVKADQLCYGLLTTFNQRGFVADLNKIQMAIKIDPWLNNVSKTMDKGTPCRIIDGPLRGTACEVIRTISGDRILLELPTLGQKIELEIDMSHIELL